MPRSASKNPFPKSASIGDIQKREVENKSGKRTISFMKIKEKGKGSWLIIKNEPSIVK